MKGEMEAFDLHAGDHVTLVDDDWTLVGHDMILVDAEPVPGSTQCIIESDGQARFVSRCNLRRANARDRDPAGR